MEPAIDKRNYALVTLAYWGFTLTDGALRMLVLLHFHTLGYSPVQLAFLFLLYEFCGILTNLFGGWIGSRMGLKITLFSGLVLQIVALTMLSFVQPDWVAIVSVAYVMGSQALSGIAKDLTKMSSKSAVKLLAPKPTAEKPEQPESDRGLFKSVALLTGSKNALKGVGFLLGGVLLSQLGFAMALWVMAGCLAAILLIGLIGIKQDLGKSKKKVKFKHLFSKTREINLLSAARLFLFGSRDIWFVVGLPVFLKETLGWSFSAVGGFLALWVIGYGFVQAAAPGFVRKEGAQHGARAAFIWCSLLLLVTAGLAACIQFEVQVKLSLLLGLGIFGFVFAVNSSVHSYLILAYTDHDKVALNVGFYYMANAMGRLVGTLLSGVMYLIGGMAWCLWASAGFVLIALVLSYFLRKTPVVLPTEEKVLLVDAV